MIKDDKDLEEKITKLIAKQLPSIIRGMNNNIRTGVITAVNIPSQSVSVSMNGTNQVIENIKYQSGASPIVNAPVIVITPDSSLTGQLRAIVY